MARWRVACNPLLIVFVVSVSLLMTGMGLAIFDIERYGAGLYLALVSVVVLVVALAFCVVGTDEQTEPTVAKKVLSTTRQTIRRYVKAKEPSRSLPPINIVHINLDVDSASHSSMPEDEEEEEQTGRREEKEQQKIEDTEELYV